MNQLDTTDPIVDWVIEYPHAVPLFEQRGVDYTCGGKSLQYACEQRGVDAGDLMQEILNPPDREAR